MKRRLVSILLTVCLMVGLCIPTWAVTTGEITKGETDYDYGGTVVTNLSATVAEPQIKVTLPTALSFTIDPTKEVTSDNPRAQITAGDTFYVLNNSAVPIYVGVKNISFTGVTATTSVSALSTGKYIMFDLYSDHTTTPPDCTVNQSNTIDHCLSKNGLVRKYYLNDTAFEKVTSTTYTDGAECYIAARIGSAFSPMDTFTVQVTFIVTTSQFSYSGGKEAL